MYKTEIEAKTLALQLCKQDGLGPDAYVPLYDKQTDSFVIYPRVSTLVYKAAKTGMLAGKSKCEFTYDSNGKLVSAQTTVARFVMDNIVIFEGDPVFYDEYVKTDWHKTKPHMFLSKISKAVVFKDAFADILAGLITYEEARCELDFGTSKGSPAKPSRVVTNTDFDITKPDVLHKTPDSIRDKVAEVFGDKAVIR